MGDSKHISLSAIIIIQSIGMSDGQVYFKSVCISYIFGFDLMHEDKTYLWWSSYRSRGVFFLGRVKNNRTSRLRTLYIKYVSNVWLSLDH